MQALKNWGAIGGLALAAILGLILRTAELSRKPMHTDEAVQAAKAGALYDQNFYRYDPHEFHGPTLYYMALPILKICAVENYAQSSEHHYRLVTALSGVALILLLFGLLDGLGRKAAVGAALFLALSPCFVYYSRYYIQEVPLVLFTSAAIVCGWRWLHCAHAGRRWFWAAALGASVGLMHATKETCIIAWAAMGAGGFGALFPVRDWHDRLPPHHPLFHSGARLKAVAQIALAALAAAFVSVLFFSSVFTNAQGPLDSIRTYGQYFGRAGGGNPHDKEFTYYLKLLLWNPSPLGLWTEAVIAVLALAGALLAFRETLARFFIFYTAALLLVYSLVAYKTPWCVLGILHGLCVLAGIGAARLLTRVPGDAFRVALGALLGAAVAHLGWQAYRLSFKYAVDDRNPYAYVQATRDAVQLSERIEALAQIHPDGRRMLVQVIVPRSEYWPLPWYLRRLERVGYWSEPPREEVDPKARTQPLDADVIVTAPDYAAEVDARIHPRRYQVNAYGLRSGMVVWLYVRQDLWEKFLTRKTVANPDAPPNLH